MQGEAEWADESEKFTWWIIQGGDQWGKDAFVKGGGCNV